jgi:hypothetical protein
VAKSNGSDYRRALGMVEIASQHALAGNYDTARNVLRAAFADGQFHRPDRIAGRLQYLAVLALADALDRKAQTASNSLSRILQDLRQVPERDRPPIQARCITAMKQLPHMKEIEKALAKAKQAYLRRDYAGAFEQIKKAKGIHRRNWALTPQKETTEAITLAGTLAMTHLMENNPSGRVMEITKDLQAKGLIES